MGNLSHRLSSDFVNVLFHRNCIQTAFSWVCSNSLACFFVPFRSIIWCVLKPRSFSSSLHFSINEEKVSYSLCCLRDCQADSCERVESCGLMLTIWTGDNWSILTSHEICDYGLISFEMRNPTLSCELNFSFVGFFHRVNVWLFLNSV